MKGTKKKGASATEGPVVYAAITPRQYAILTEIKRTTGLSIANQVRAKVRELEAEFLDRNPAFKA